MRALLCATGMLASFSATAASAPEHGFYLGGGFGEARIDIDKSDINSALTGLGVVSPTTSTDEKDTTWKRHGAGGG